eukprot:Selendium_serpulae@DN5839_c0_g1_i1.p1
MSYFLLQETAAEFWLHHWESTVSGDGTGAAAEAAIAVSDPPTVAGQVKVTEVVTTVAADATTGGAFYLTSDEVGTTVVDCVYWGPLLTGGLSDDCTEITPDLVLEEQVYSLAPAGALGTYLGEVKFDYTENFAADGDAGVVCMSATDASAKAKFVGSNTATAFVNEVVFGVGFEVAVLGAGTYMLYVGNDLAAASGVEEGIAITGGKAGEWSFITAALTTAADWDNLGSGYAVLFESADTTGPILSSIAWGDAAPAFKDIDGSGVFVYPLVVHAAALAADEGLYVTGDPMATSGEGTWVYSSAPYAPTSGAANTGQVLSGGGGGTGDETTDAPPAGGEGTTDGGGGITKTTTTTLGGEETTTAAESETGRGRTSKIGVFAVMGSMMALVLSS